MSSIHCLRLLIFKSNRKSLNRFGSAFSCFIMLIVLIIEIVFELKDLGSHSHHTWYWLVLECLFMFVFGFTLGIVIWLYVS